MIYHFTKKYILKAEKKHLVRYLVNSSKDFLEKANKLRKLLQLKRSPVAIGMCKKPPRELFKLSGRMEFCAMWRKALNGEAFFATPDNHDCLTGRYYLGLSNEDVREAVCNFLVNQVHAYKSRKTVEKYLRKFPRLKHGQLKIACISPLETASFKPDIVIVVCNAEQAMLLLWTYSYHMGEPVQGYTGTATCRSTYIEPYLTRKPSFSLGDPGGRYIMELPSDEIVVSFPAELFNSMVETLNTKISDWKS